MCFVRKKNYRKVSVTQGLVIWSVVYKTLYSKFAFSIHSSGIIVHYFFILSGNRKQNETSQCHLVWLCGERKC